MFGIPRLDDWIQLIRGEFQEVPGLRVTIDDAAELWGLDSQDLQRIFEAFVDVGFLQRALDGSYQHAHPTRQQRCRTGADP